jgi:hypothetical protein
MKVRYVTALIALPLFVTLTGAAQQPPTDGGGRTRGQSAPVGERGRGRGPADPFAGQPRINALVVSGGCCHDYALQGRLMMDAISRVLPVDWTLAVQGGRGTRGSMPVYARPTGRRGSTSSSTMSAWPTSTIRSISGISPPDTAVVLPRS